MTITIAVVEQRIKRTLTDPERTSLAVLLGSLSVVDDGLDDVLEALAALLGVENPDMEDDMEEMSSLVLKDAAKTRAQQVRQATDRPRQRRSGTESDSTATVRVALRSVQCRAAGGEGGGNVITGYASVTEAPYVMYDFFGPYTEIVSRGAFEATLATSPLVEFTINHGAGGGIPMAHTRNGTLLLSEDETGLRFEATVDPARADVATVLLALERQDLAEASFKFRIDSGQWSPDYEEFRINAVDLDRGDVSAVNFGANPAASSGVRQQSQEQAPKPARDLRAALIDLALADV